MTGFINKENELSVNEYGRKTAALTEEYEEKKARLKKQIRTYADEGCIVAFSGGVDSSLLLKLVCGSAKESGRPAQSRIYAVTMQTRLHPVCEMEHAGKVAEEIGASHMVIPVDELEEAGISQNPVDRCYLCKKHLFTKILETAGQLEIRNILEGTNEDDLHVYRPGLKAIRELGIISPLADAGFTKADVRRLAEEYGLSVSDRPAMPCLATRFPYGTALSYKELQKVERGEEYLKSFGLYNVRLRIHDPIVRIEVEPNEFPLLLPHRQEIILYLKNLGYAYITLDLEGFRSGSMDIDVTVPPSMSFS